MLRLLVLTSDTSAAEGVEQTAAATGVIRALRGGCPIPKGHEALRLINIQQPEVVLLDLTHWEEVAGMAEKIRDAKPDCVLLGFRADWTEAEALEFEAAGIRGLLPEPFTPKQQEDKVFETVHAHRPITHRDILAFLPAKAGSGSTTIAMNTAVAFANHLGRKTLLMESDMRAGILSILLNLKNRVGLPEALANATDLSPVEWTQHCVRSNGVDLLLANAQRSHALSQWSGYYQLLHYVQKNYDVIIADLPELVNPATAEFVRAARAVFIVCTPELPSLSMAPWRIADLERHGVEPSKIHCVVNRWERKGMSAEDAAEILGRPVYATMPNAYKEVKEATLAGRPAQPASALAKSCEALARKTCRAEPQVARASGLPLLRKLGLSSA